MMALWNEFRPDLISVEDVRLSARKIAGVPIPVLDGVEFRIARYSLFSAPSWYADGIELLKTMAETGIEDGSEQMPFSCGETLPQGAVERVHQVL